MMADEKKCLMLQSLSHADQTEVVWVQDGRQVNGTETVEGEKKNGANLLDENGVVVRIFANSIKFQIMLPLVT
jgi:hypothetical protein